MIFQMSEDFRAALDEGRGGRVYGGMLDALDLYVRNHFGFEEECMERHRCPVAGLNAAAHARFMEVLAGFRGRFAAAGFSRSDALDLVDSVDRWIESHICRIDVQLRKSVEGD